MTLGPIDPGWAAVTASFVSLVLGVTSIVRSSSDSKGIAERERQKRRAEAYVDVLRIVETRGVAVQDEMYNYTDTFDDPYGQGPSLPKRKLAKPDRADRAEARALLAAYGTATTRAAFETWLDAVDAWEAKLAGWFLEADVSGPPELTSSDAEPERANESAARTALGLAVSRELAA